MMNLMIDSAEKQGLWMFCQYQALWFSPQELRKAQSEGRFRWGPVNWEVRDPQERMAELERGITSAIKDRDDFAKRLSLNPSHQGTTHLVRRTLDGVVGSLNQEG